MLECNHISKKLPVSCFANEVLDGCIRINKIQEELRSLRDMLYNSTRTAGKQVKASEAILRGLSEDGGLFVPESIPALDKSLKELSQMSYQQVAYEVMKLYLTDFTEEELRSLIPKRSLLWFMQKMLIIWNCSTVQRLHSRIWHYPFCLIY